MSGVLRFHDITYELLGKILEYSAEATIWSVKTLTTAVLNSLDNESKIAIRKKSKAQDTEVRRLVYYAKRKGYIDKDLNITKPGVIKLEQIDFNKIRMNQPWDGKWRLVMFDIPESKRVLRREIRRLIKQLGFIQLQQSVWIHPLPCLDEFRQIKKTDNLEGSLILVETGEIEGHGELLTYFRKIYPNL